MMDSRARAQSAAVPVPRATSPLRSAGRLAARHRGGTVGFALVVGCVLIAVAAPALAPFDPTRQDLPHQSQSPGGRYLLGTDQLGRDVLSRVIYGARISLAVGLLAVGLGASAGVAVGIVSGYAGGWFDHLLM
ncbi:MAG: nickel ABC transporter permease subunit NikC, partial [Armatimonadetes bacterium]|nr:nickel ABC transporter permease subunit NikC [Armatimonadota bacterium]